MIPASRIAALALAGALIGGTAYARGQPHSLGYPSRNVHLSVPPP
jgi:hypothetical protein